MENAVTDVEKKKLGMSDFSYEIEPQELDSNIESLMIDSFSLGREVNKFFKLMTDDYVGCKITLDNNSVVCTLFFQDNPIADNSDKFKAVIPSNVINKAHGSIIDIVNSAYNPNRHSLTLTEDAKKVFKDFIPFRHYVTFDKLFDDKGNVIWNKIYSETTIRNQFGGFSVNKPYTYGVLVIDLTRWLAKIYGEKSGNDYYQYEVSVVRNIMNPFATNFSGFYANNTKYLLNVTRYNQETIKKLALENNIIPTGNELGIII